MDNLDNIEIAVTIPCFGHPGLMSEAILSLANFNSNKIGIVLVNDGCKYKETEIKGIIYQSQIKNLYYIKKLNGGLASARNAGIDYSLKLFKNLQYITFLDPDDRIETQEIIKASSFLNKERRISYEEFCLSLNQSF